DVRRASGRRGAILFRNDSLWSAHNDGCRVPFFRPGQGAVAAPPFHSAGPCVVRGGVRRPPRPPLAARPARPVTFRARAGRRDRMSGGHPAAGEPFYFATTRCGAHTMMDVVCHFFDPDKAPLLRRHFIPLARALSAEGYAVHLDRHWLHGPHVLLRFAPGPGV